MKRIIHAPLVILAAVPWAFGCLLFAVALGLTILADRVWPNATHGNCWSFVGPRWWRYGGYLLIRPADDVRVLGVGIIPHAIWVHGLAEDNELKQTVPLERSLSTSVPWRTLYFRFKVIRKERPRNSDRAEL